MPPRHSFLPHSPTQPQGRRAVVEAVAEVRKGRAAAALTVDESSSQKQQTTTYTLVFHVATGDTYQARFAEHTCARVLEKDEKEGEDMIRKKKKKNVLRA